MYLLDTNVVSELRRPAKANPKVLAWATEQSADAFHLSAISILEVRVGVLRAARKDAAQAGLLAAWLDTILNYFAGRILPVDTRVALRCAEMHVPDPRSDRDALIAATALEHRLTVVTRNEADFKAFGVPLFNPWKID